MHDPAGHLLVHFVEDPQRGRWLLWLDQSDRMPQGGVAHASDDPFSGHA